MPEAARDCLVFGLLVAAVGLPVAGLLPGRWPLVRLAAGIGGGLILIYLATFGLYVAGAAWVWLGLLPLAGLAVAVHRRASVRALLTDPAVGAAVIGWLLLAGWCLGWQALVTSYAGGGWAGDWNEHYDRARFFALHWPLDHRFIGFNPLPARPPLVNVIIGGLLGVVGTGIGHFQVFATLFSSLVYFPLAALTQKYGGSRPALGGLTLLLMLNPLLVENATFPWTKLGAAFFVLLAVALLPRRGDGPQGTGAALVALAAGLLAHYSTAPWIIALGAAWLWLLLPARGDPVLRRELAWGAALSAGLLATWFGWGAGHYGEVAMVRAPTAVSLVANASWTERVGIAAGNIGHTLVPNWDSSILGLFQQQPDWFSRWRDVWFSLYQQNLPVALGLGNVFVLGWLVSRRRFRAVALPWLVVVPLALVIGAVATTGPVDLGVTHICLQPLVLLGLAWLAAGTAELPRGWRLVWGAGLALDLALGIVLHFGLQSFTWLRLAHPGMAEAELVGRLNLFAGLNHHGKLGLGQPFLGDLLAAHRGLVVVLLAVLLALALAHWRGAGAKMASPARPGPP